MARTMWFGPPGHLKPIKVHQGGGGHSPVGYTESVQFLNGRKAVRRSLGSHMEYDWTWTGKRREVAHLIDCYNGDFGEAPFFFLDPMWTKYNVLPSHWASPAKSAKDAPLIYGVQRPALASTPANTRGWPSHGAVFQRQTSVSPKELYIPIPPGMRLHVWYAGTSGILRLVSMSGNDRGGVITPYVSNVTDNLVTQQHSTVTAGVSVDGALLSVQISSAQGEGTIYGIRAVVVPVGFDLAKLEQDFIGGRGHSGVDFETLTISPYSEPFDSVGLTARLIEVD